MRTIFIVAAGVCFSLFSSGCWQVAAARAAKKRTNETGYVVGTIERESGIGDPLGRKQRSLTDCQNQASPNPDAPAPDEKN